jgi:hypothetical protein
MTMFHKDGLCQNCGKEGDIWGSHFTRCRGPQNCTHIHHQIVIDALVFLVRVGNFHPIKDANVR